MYFWKTDKLIDDLRNDRLTEENYKNYYLAGAIITLLGLAGAAINVQHNLNVFVELIINIGLLITAINLIFKANGGNQGQNFLNRIISLYFPIILKGMVIYFILLVIIYTVAGSIYGLDYEGKPLMINWQWFESIILFIFQIFVYWRIYVAMKKVNS